MTVDAKKTIKVALYEDNAALRCSLSKLFEASFEFDFIGAYAEATLLIENCQYRKPDVILMDIEMPGISGIEAVRKLQLSYPEIKVLMLTVFEDNESIFQSICHGAIGYILKKEDPLEIIKAVIEAHDGGAPMTPLIATKVIEMFRRQAPQPLATNDLSEREREILALLARGFSYKMIANERAISIDTVRFHIKKIYEKLQVHSMTEAVSKAIKNKWV